jgi:hypothetical protein
MKLHSQLTSYVLAGILAAFSAACGSSDSSPIDSSAPVVAVDAKTADDTSPVLTPDTAKADAAPVANEAGAVDAGQGVDGTLDGQLRPDDAVALSDGAKDAGDGQAPGSDGAADATADTFDPGPIVPIVVNSVPSGQFNLGDGKWQVFSFDGEANQVYSLSELSGIVSGYVSTSPTVSSTNYQFKTNTAGNLSFVAPAAQKYYLAVAIKGGGASGSFQVADGGRLLALGATTLTLTAPTGDDYYFFHFPITAGHAYSVTMAAPGQSSVRTAVSARAERSSIGQFSYALQGIGGGLPITHDIPATSVAESYSGFYYFFISVSQTMTVTFTLTQTS